MSNRLISRVVGIEPRQPVGDLFFRRHAPGRKDRAGKDAEHDVLIVDLGLVVGALPDLAECQCTAVGSSRRFLQDPEAGFHFTEELHGAVHAHHTDVVT